MTSDSTTAVIVDFKERCYRAILKEQLIDNAILELCFEVHREVKLNFPITDLETWINGKNMKSNKIITCFSCGAKKGPNNFTGHLVECMGNPEESEAKSRKAKNKLINFKEWNSEDDDDDADHLKKSERNKKSAKGKLKSSGNNSLSKSPHARSSLGMSADEIKAFLIQKCGVVTKRSKKLCSNSLKCSIHSEIERTSVRDDLLRDVPDNLQIDVDTVEKSDIKMAFSTDGNISDYPSGSLAYF